MSTSHVQMCLWGTRACKDKAPVAVALKEEPFLGRKGTYVKNSDQNGLRKVQEVLSEDIGS